MINRKTRKIRKNKTKRNNRTKRKNYKSKQKKGGMICIGTPHTTPKIVSGTPHTPPVIKTPTKDDSLIGVISYNISWEAMTGSATGKAAVLGKYCVTQSPGHTVGSPTTCLYNVQIFLQKEVNDKSKNICFIGLQEAALWKTIVEDKEKVLQKMGYVHHSIKKDTYDVDLCTLYDATKFKVLAAKWGNLVAGDARPYHIIFFRRISNDAIYIFINLHNGHAKDKTQLQNALTQNIDDLFDLENDTNIHFENIQTAKITKNTSDIIKSDPFVIVVGDTNDKNSGKFYKGLKPFTSSTNNFLTDITVRTDKQPPNTCCNTQRKIKDDSKLGDYIMINDKLKYTVENVIPPDFDFDFETNPTSDHLPIYSSLQEK
jgi:hypothetical protein